MSIRIVELLRQGIAERLVRSLSDWIVVLPALVAA
jgi:hypothetical protein